jgi:2-polyprenyl-3-methyl-5-hydroxy-6-metoxy-1,4-benzoquinol methylase/tetratricopeptide (TPR) repeat protein
MNRKQRRAAPKQSPSRGGAADDSVAQLLAQALRHEHERKLDDAVRAYRRVVQLKPDHTEAYNNLGRVLQTQGKLREASACFAQTLLMMPQLLEQYAGVSATLIAVLPAIGEAMRRASKAWPERLSVEQLLGSAGLAAICDDPMLLCLLQSAPPRHIDFERLMTLLRLVLLDDASGGKPAAPPVLAFCCALAKQCFINEYVFSATPDEEAKVERLAAALADAIGSATEIAPFAIAAVAMYRPLHSIANAPALLDRTWPPAVDDVVTQQVREPAQELALRASIPSLTPIDDEVSQRVRQQYEENPYPRWVNAAGLVTPVALDAFLRGKFPTAGFTPLGKTETLDILVPGCGTGMQATIVAQDYQGARVLALDLSLGSLGYAKRKLPVRLSDRLDYAQGDILKLGGIGRSFDMIDVTGVLHHMRDPFEGWRILLSLLRPRGIMHLGFYSEVARADVVAARAFIAERGYTTTVADIRRCRQDLLQTPLGSVVRYSDFFSMSECRDLLFHVQEIRMTIPAIKAFIDSHGLKFIGFDLNEPAAQGLRALFADAGWSMSDLGKWDVVEAKFPNTFGSMYQFWVQKTD